MPTLITACCASALSPATWLQQTRSLFGQSPANTCREVVPTSGPLLFSNFVEEFFLSGGPSSSEVRVVVVHDIKEVEGERQQEVQEDKRFEEIGCEVDGEVEESHSTCA